MRRVKVEVTYVEAGQGEEQSGLSGVVPDDRARAYLRRWIERRRMSSGGNKADAGVSYCISASWDHEHDKG